MIGRLSAYHEMSFFPLYITFYFTLHPGRCLHSCFRLGEPILGDVLVELEYTTMTTLDELSYS